MVWFQENNQNQNHQRLPANEFSEVEQVATEHTQTKKVKTKKHEVNISRQITTASSNTQINTNVEDNSQKKKDAYFSHLSAL